MKEPNLHDPAEWTGHWWLPADPETVVAGVLRFEPNHGLTLSLVGGFEDRILRQIGPNSFAVLDGSQVWPVIHGVAANKEITLLECIATHSQSYNMGPTAQQSVAPLTALIGVHLNNSEEAKFAAVEASVENLTRWSADSVFSGSLGLADDERPDGTGTIKATPVDTLSTTFGDLTAYLEHRHTLPFFDRRRDGTVGRMVDTAVFRLKTLEPADFSRFFDEVKGIQDLLSLATHMPCAVIWQVLILAQENLTGKAEQHMPKRRVDCYNRHIVKASPDARPTATHELLFSLGEVDFGLLLPRWFEIKDKFAATVNMVLGIWYMPDGYLESELVVAVAAAESMHRALGLPPPIADAEFSDIKKTLLDTVSRERKAWLSGLLARNEPTLKERLVELARRPDTEAMRALVPDPETWAKKASEARNGIAHTGRASNLSLDELDAVARVTSAVVLLNLLHEIGLSPEVLRKGVASNNRLRHAAKLARAHLTRLEDGPQA